ncbi:hypothetical protein ABTX77_30035 [Streptomyces sp. NPDC097704]|uniref:hypothetical protein n=1 Tax=Streptomyces sp. NPDC097704 TaxID=3157101 RepID=UPI00332988A3
MFQNNYTWNTLSYPYENSIPSGPPADLNGRPSPVDESALAGAQCWTATRTTPAVSVDHLTDLVRSDAWRKVAGANRPWHRPGGEGRLRHTRARPATRMEPAGQAARHGWA